MAQADIGASTLIRHLGLEGAAGALRGHTAPDAEYAQGVILMLRAIEKLWQTRIAHGLNGPILRLPVLAAPLPHAPGQITLPAIDAQGMLQTYIDDLARARAHLEAIPPGIEPELVIDVDDIWLDLDGDGQRGIEESAAHVLAAMMLTPQELAAFHRIEHNADIRLARFHLDAADMWWLLGRNRINSAFAEFAMAWPLVQLGTELSREAGERTVSASEYIDRAWDLASLPPEPARVQAARDHALQGIAAMRNFLNELAREKDDNHEFLPGPGQSAPYRRRVDEGDHTRWMAILDQGEQLLRGQLLHHNPRRDPPGMGLDFAAWIDNPTRVPIQEWLSGGTQLEHLKEGPLDNFELWEEFKLFLQGRLNSWLILDGMH